MFLLHDRYEQWESEFRSVFPKNEISCVACSRRMTKETCSGGSFKEYVSCDWDGQKCTIDPMSDYVNLRDRIRQSKQELPPIPYDSILVDILRDNEYKIDDDYQRNLRNLPVFIQAQMVYVYSQLKDDDVPMIFVDLIRTKIFSYSTNETWDTRLDVLQSIIDRLSSLPKTNIKRRKAATRSRYNNSKGSRSKRMLTLLSMTGLMLGTADASIIPSLKFELSSTDKRMLSAEEQLKSLKTQLDGPITSAVRSIVKNPKQPINARMDAESNYYLETVFKSLRIMTENKLNVLQPYVPDTEDTWSLLRREDMEVNDVNQILDLTVDNPSYSTTFGLIYKLLPDIHEMLGPWFSNDLDTYQQEEFLLIWMFTMKVIEHATQPDAPISEITVKDVEFYLDRFKDPYGTWADQLTMTSGTGFRVNIVGVSKTINGLIRGVNMQEEFTQIIQNLHADFERYKEESESRYEKTLQSFLSVFEHLTIMVALLVFMPLVSAVSYLLYKLGKCTSCKPKHISDTVYVGPTTVPPSSSDQKYESPYKLFKCEVCEIGYDTDKAYDKHLKSGAHKRRLEKKKRIGMTELNALVTPEKRQTRSRN